MFTRFLAIFFGCRLAAMGAEQTPTPRHDPLDQLFRRAPMAESARSIVVNLGTNLHAAFDTERARVHTIWKGGPLNLWGPPYSHSKSPFIANFEGERVFSFPQEGVWNSPTEPMKIDYLGVRIEGNAVRFEYEAGDVRIVETLEGVAAGEEWMVRRTFEFPEGGNRLEAMSYLAFAEAGAKIEEGRVVKIQGTNGVAYFTLEPAAFRWTVGNFEADYKSELITEAGTEKGNPMAPHRGREARVFVELPKNGDRFSFSIVMSSGPKPLRIPSRPVEKGKVFCSRR